MALTAGQLAAIKADILAAGDMNTLPNNSDGAFAIAALYNKLATPDFFAWQTAVPVDEVNDAINWANFTPQDAADTTQIWANRSLACQGKQFNLQLMTAGRTNLNAAKANLRAGIQDCLTAIPSGAAGAPKGGGWAAVQLILSRKVTRLEKLLGTGTGTQVAPATMTFEGAVDYQTIEVARNS